MVSFSGSNFLLLAMLPIPPPNLTASAVTTPFESKPYPFGILLVNSTYPSVPSANSNVPRYTQVLPLSFWLTMKLSDPPIWWTVYRAAETLSGRLLYEIYTEYSPLFGMSALHMILASPFFASERMAAALRAVPNANGSSSPK